jgi:precorrin-6B methylase 2
MRATVSLSAMPAPHLDPTPIFELFRGNYATELLTAAVCHFNLFGRLSRQSMTLPELARELGLAERPATVLVTGLRAMGLLVMAPGGRLAPSDLAREHLLPESIFNVSGYLGLAAQSPGVRNMLERLRSNRPAGTKPDEAGAVLIFREGLKSAMEDEGLARDLTLALAGRAKVVAPFLAKRVDLKGARMLLDVGGGTGIYSIAFLEQYPDLRAVVLDHPKVLGVTREMAAAYGVAERLESLPGDMFRDDLPAADVVLLSNVLHDWDIPECRVLIERCARTLPDAGRLVVHDVFLNDALDGPLPIALYSAQLFCLTEGRAYSAAEYRAWLTLAGFAVGDVIPTMIHNCGALVGIKT